MTSPDASIVSTAVVSSLVPTSTIRPSAMATSVLVRVPVGSTTVPFSRTRSAGKGGSGAEEEEQDGHADGDPVGDLPRDDGVGELGDLGRDLHAAVHRAGVHDEGAVLEVGGSSAGESVVGGVLAEARQQGFGHALLLH